MLKRLCISSNTSSDRADAARIEDALPGDRQVFEELYHQTIKRVYSLVMRIVGSAQEADDATQEAYLQAYRSFKGFAGRASFFTWMYRIAMNVALQHVKSRTRRNRILAIVPEAGESSPGVSASFNPEHELARRRLYLALKNGIGLLPPTQRAVLVAGPIQGHSYEEMSGGLGLSQDVIKGRLHRARRGLKARLAKVDEMPDESVLKLAS